MNSIPAPSPQTAPPSSVPAPLPPIRHWIGIDWADQQHCVVVRPPDGQPAQTHWVAQTPEALDAFFLQLHARYPDQRLGVCLEQSRGPLLYALLKHNFLALYPINPRVLADFRRAFAVSGAKDDPRDASLLAELGAKHHERLRPLVPEEATIRRLRLLTEDRRTSVDERTALLNRLTATLKCYYPLALELFDAVLATPLALDFLRRWPNLACVQAAKPATLRKFFYAHNCRSAECLQQRLDAIPKARALTDDAALVEPLQQRVLGLVEQLTVLQTLIADYDTTIATVFASHTDAALFADLPGAGPVLAPRLLAAFGSQRENFPTALALECWSGVAPVTRQSGQTLLVHCRWARPTFLHQSLVEFAKSSVLYCDWARLLFEEQRHRGKGAWAAYRAVAYKWVRILWRCWQQREPYDEARYLRSLQKHGVKLYQTLYATDPQPAPAPGE